jgi:hypothetical protein
MFALTASSTTSCFSSIAYMITCRCERLADSRDVTANLDCAPMTKLHRPGEGVRHRGCTRFVGRCGVLSRMTRKRRIGLSAYVCAPQARYEGTWGSDKATAQRPNTDLRMDSPRSRTALVLFYLAARPHPFSHTYLALTIGRLPHRWTGPPARRRSSPLRKSCARGKRYISSGRARYVYNAHRRKPA